MSLSDAVGYQGLIPFFTPAPPPPLVAVTCGYLTCGYLTCSAVIASFYVAFAHREDAAFNIVLALLVVLVSGTLAAQLWSMPGLWR